MTTGCQRHIKSIWPMRLRGIPALLSKWFYACAVLTWFLHSFLHLSQSENHHEWQPFKVQCASCCDTHTHQSIHRNTIDERNNKWLVNSPRHRAHHHPCPLCVLLAVTESPEIGTTVSSQFQQPPCLSYTFSDFLPHHLNLIFQVQSPRAPPIISL